MGCSWLSINHTRVGLIDDTKERSWKFGRRVEILTNIVNLTKLSISHKDWTTPKSPWIYVASDSGQINLPSAGPNCPSRQSAGVGSGPASCLKRNVVPSVTRCSSSVSTSHRPAPPTQIVVTPRMYRDSWTFLITVETLNHCQLPSTNT